MLNSSSQILGVVAVAGFISVMAFNRARERARRSRRTRRRLIAGGIAGVPLGLLLVFWLPNQLPINIESPGAIFFFLGPWIAGGALVLLSLASILGAVLSNGSTAGVTPIPPRRELVPCRVI